VRSTKRILFVLLMLAVSLAAVAVASAAEEDKVVFTVGFPGDYDTLNPLVGVEVPDYEIWNLQYATLTDKAAADFATTPGLAESWEMSNGGKTYTYTLRTGLTWSDGTPLTAEDVAYTVNRARDEEWQNYTSTVANLTAKVIDPQTVEITSSVKDPKLPTMDVYILPQHVWGKQDKAAITKYEGTDGVGSGPFTLVEAKRGQFMRLQANDGYWGGRPAIDEVVFRLFTNRDAMVAALEKGEIDAAHDIPTEAFERLSTIEGIVAIQGEQGGFNELAVNGGRPQSERVEGIGNGHPAHRSGQRRHRQARHDREPVAESRMDPRDPGGGSIPLRPRQGPGDPHCGRVCGRGRQRHPRAAERWRRHHARLRGALRVAVGTRRRRVHQRLA
jgi:peptide/nickel transport system substrate-binding protein